MKNIKTLITITLSALLALVGTSFAQEAVRGTGEISTEILDSAPKTTYTEDKSGVKWKDFNTGKQIRDIGRRLGAEIKFQAEENKAAYPYCSGQPDYKYKAARVFPGEKLGADIIFMSKSAKAGTFKNLTRIVSGYIERAYGIPMESADAIAQKVCWWNTAHYQDTAYFAKSFEPRVLEVFSNSTKKIGLSQNYKNWPGQARIVIPFAMVKAQDATAQTPAEEVENQEIPEDLKEETPQEEVPAQEETTQDETAQETPAEEESTEATEEVIAPAQEEVQEQANQGTLEQVSIEKQAVSKNSLFPVVIVLSLLLLLALIIIAVLAVKYKKSNNSN